MNKKTLKNINFSGIYVLPAMFLLIMLLIVPLLYALYSSFFPYRYMVKGEYLGFSNYIDCFTSPRVIQSFIFTFILTIASTGISIVIGLVLALWIDKRTGYFAYFIELIGLIPWVISMVVAGLLWRWLLNTELGLFNVIIRSLGMESIAVINEKYPARFALMFVMSWRTIGYAMVMILAGLKGIDHNLIEASHIDGANSLQTLFKIKLPIIKSSVLLSTIVLTVSNFTNNTVPKVLTGGGPVNATNVVTLEQYNLSFVYYEFGQSSALSVLIMLVTVVIIAFYIKIAKYEI
jgi:ABC-type sugar transport system permease subunit